MLNAHGVFHALFDDLRVLKGVFWTLDLSHDRFEHLERMVKNLFFAEVFDHVE